MAIMDINKNHEVLFSNFKYDPEVYYFLYCGDIKAYYLNRLLQEALQVKFSGREVRFLAVVPDFFRQYDYQDVIVINPAISRHQKCSIDTVNQGNNDISCRISSADFMTAVSSSSALREHIDTILQNQDNLYIYLFESVQEMTLDEIDCVSILGPDRALSIECNNKILQYQQVAGLVPTAEHCFCDDVESLLRTTKKLRRKWKNGIFISCAYSAAGSNSLVSLNQEEVQTWSVGKEGTFLVSRYMPHTLDPTVLAVVANESDVYIAGIADQSIEDGNRFVGSTYPSMVTPYQKKQLNRYTVLVGQMLGRLGYRGIFGCDYIVANDDTVYFIEINARKQGTTLEFCYTLEQGLPKGTPLLPELEYYAVTENRFPDNCIELQATYDSIYWGTHNYKALEQKRTKGFVPNNPYERQSFAKIARGDLKNDFVVLEHVGTDFIVMPGTFVGRVVSVAENRKNMETGLRQGVGFIKQTIEEA